MGIMNSVIPIQNTILFLVIPYSEQALFGKGI